MINVCWKYNCNKVFYYELCTVLHLCPKTNNLNYLIENTIDSSILTIRRQKLIYEFGRWSVKHVKDKFMKYISGMRRKAFESNTSSEGDRMKLKGCLVHSCSRHIYYQLKTYL